ncbi:MAG: leucine-rich repeat protein [Lachnospiraceae bacterium]
MRQKTRTLLLAGILASLVISNSKLINAADLETTDQENVDIEIENENPETEIILEQNFLYEEAESADDVGNNIVSGKCGENVEYELNLSTGAMRIYGSGAMDDYGWTDNYGMIRAPWIREEYDSGIISIKVEEGVTHIGNYAFYSGYSNKYCENVQSAEIAGTVETIGEDAFAFCNKLTLIKGAEGIKSIGKEAFSATSLTDFPWSDSLERIEDSAFSSNDFVEILMPSKVQLIGGKAFSNCKYLKVLSTSDNCEIKSNAFELCNALENVTIGSGCKIRGGTFRECSLLKNIFIGEGSTCISDANKDYTVGGIFKNCTSLQTILLPDSWRFYDDENGEETGAYILQFEGCTQLKDIRFQDTNNRYKVIDSVVFSKDGSTLIYYPLVLKAMEYEISDNVTKIGAFAFHDNENIENVFIPSSVKEIKTRAFGSCTKLKNVIIPEGMEELGIGIFSYCKNLNAVVIPPSVNKIDRNYKSSTATFGDAGLKVVYGEKDSYAQEFAGQTGYKFENTIYCSFDENGGNTNEKKKTVIYNDKYHKLPTPTRTGYKFLGWYTEKEAGEKIESDTIVSAKASHILYAHWEKEYLKGDVNDDGTVNILDLRIVLRNICGKVELTKQQIIIADVVMDGVIDIQDLRLELRFVCGKIQEL